MENSILSKVTENKVAGKKNTGFKKLTCVIDKGIRKVDKLDKAIRKIGVFLSVKKNKVMTYLSYFALNLVYIPLSLSADEGVADATSSWNAVMDFLITWIPRLGAVLLFIGGLEFAIAYKNEDANSKTNAVRLMVSGAMVIALPVALKSLLRIGG